MPDEPHAAGALRFTVLLMLAAASVARRARPTVASRRRRNSSCRGRFGTVTVYIPRRRTGERRAVPLRRRRLESRRRQYGAARSPTWARSSIGVDIRAIPRRAGKRRSPKAPCQLIAGDFENLSHQIQKEIGMNEYHVPVLVGYSSGATVVYATLVQSPPGTFAGAISLGFCPDQDFSGAALCPGAGLHYTPRQKDDLIFEPAKNLKQPWIAFQGQKDQVCAPHRSTPSPRRPAGGEVVQLPTVGHGFWVERNWMPQFLRRLRQHNRSHSKRPPRGRRKSATCPSTRCLPRGTSSDEMALLLTGDGGWAGLDQELAARLAAQRRAHRGPELAEVLLDRAHAGRNRARRRPRHGAITWPTGTNSACCSLATPSARTCCRS